MTRRFRYAQGSPNMANLLLIDDDPDPLPNQIAHVFPSPEHRVEVAPPAPKVFAAPPQCSRMSLSWTCVCPASLGWTC